MANETRIGLERKLELWTRILNTGTPINRNAAAHWIPIIERKLKNLKG